jgi:hypothetical protein
VTKITILLELCGGVCIQIPTYASAGNGKKLRRKLPVHIYSLYIHLAFAYSGAGG